MNYYISLAAVLAFGISTGLANAADVSGSIGVTGQGDMTFAPA